MTGEYDLAVPSGLKVVSKKKHLIDRLPTQTDLPAGYTSNMAKEETILEYVEDFRRQFVQVFPERRPLLLVPLNEFNVRKFVCTTVRPTLLPYNSVYNLKDTSRFVSDFLEYLHVDEPTRLPDILPSPSTTLKLRAGDCLDFANLLVSLLRGAAYDAYVVSGYAPKCVCVRDESLCKCPILEETENPLDRDTRLKKDAEEAAEAAKPKRRPPRVDENPEGEGDNAEATDEAKAEGEEAAAAAVEEPVAAAEPEAAASEAAEAPAKPAKAAKAAKAAKPKKEKKPAKAKAAPTHPKYSVMITAAVGALKDRTGSSRQAILKYICANYTVDDKKAATQTRLSLKRMTEGGELRMAKEKGKGAGCYKLADKADKAAAAPPAKKPAAKKPAAKKAPAKKPAAAPKKPAKKAAKPKAAAKLKPAAKKSAAKKPAAKKTAKKAGKKGKK